MILRKSFLRLSPLFSKEKVKDEEEDPSKREREEK